MFTLGLLLFGPSLAFLWHTLYSKDYYPGDYRLWRLFRRGFRYWPRIVKLNLWALLFFLPLTLLNWFLVFRAFPADLAAINQRTTATH